MMKSKIAFVTFLCPLFFTACYNTKGINANSKNTISIEGFADTVQLPAPFATPAVRNNSKTIGWPQDKVPTAPEEFLVTRDQSRLYFPHITFCFGE